VPLLACPAVLDAVVLRAWRGGKGIENDNPVWLGLVVRAVDWKWSSARYYVEDPPRQYPGLPTINSLPAEWLDEPN
jgi:hypothetical protein